MTMTPYAAAKFVNAALKEAGLTKVVPPQMMYNYTTARVNAGKAPLIAFTLEGGVDEAALQTWTAKYVAKQVAATLPADEEDTPIEGLAVEA
jgi:hypothetical protein